MTSAHPPHSSRARGAAARHGPFHHRRRGAAGLIFLLLFVAVLLSLAVMFLPLSHPHTPPAEAFPEHPHLHPAFIPSLG